MKVHRRQLPEGRLLYTIHSPGPERGWAARATFDLDSSLITGIEVRPAYRGEGRASALLGKVFADHGQQAIFLHVQADGSGGFTNLQLREFYRRHGFVGRGNAMVRPAELARIRLSVTRK